MAYKKKEAAKKLCKLPSCNVEFETARERKEFCSGEHQQEFQRLIRQVGVCPYCGKELLSA